MIDEKQYRQLVEQLNRLSYEYHTLDNPSISDADYDRLIAQARDFEKQHPTKVSPNSPSQRVGGQLSAGFQRVAHAVPMLSLSDHRSWQEVVDWANRCAKNLSLPTDDLEYFVDIKMDGLALSLIYIDGLFEKAITRGNGGVGEDVSQKRQNYSKLATNFTENTDVAKATDN